MDEFAELKTKYDRLQLLHQVGSIIHSTLEPQEALRLILREAVRLMRASSGSVVLLNPTTGLLEIHAAEGLPEKTVTRQFRLGEGLTGWVARAGKSARVGDVTKDPRYVMLRPEVRSELAVPFELAGEVRGVLNVESERLEAFGADDQALLEALAAEAASAIHHTWLYEQIRLKARLFESLASVSRAINSALDLDEALRVITREACAMMNAKICSLMLLDPAREWLDLRASFGAGAAYLRQPRVNVEDSLLGIVIRRKKPLQLENVQTSSRYQHREVARREGLVALLSVPLLFGGQATGTLNVYTGRPYSFSNEEVRILSALAELSAIAIEKARLYERVVDVEEQLRRNEKLSALGLLAAEVAHEIRNPLTVMKMLYHSLGLQFPADDPRAKDARIIGQKMEHLNKIVEHILGFARTTEPRLAPLNLNELITESGLLVRHKLKQQGIQWVQNLQSDLPLVLGDAGQLEQACLNVILNAAEAMPRGGVLAITSRTLRLPGATRRGEPGEEPSADSASASQADRSEPALDAPDRSPAAPSRKTATPLHVALDFQDTGPGMSDQQRRRAFSSVLSTTKAKGTGLGLAIVARIVETHRGRLKIKSRPGHGTTVSLILPCQYRA